MRHACRDGAVNGLELHRITDEECAGLKNALLTVAAEHEPYPIRVKWSC